MYTNPAMFGRGQVSLYDKNYGTLSPEEIEAKLTPGRASQYRQTLRVLRATFCSSPEIRERNGRSPLVSLQAWRPTAQENLLTMSNILHAELNGRQRQTTQSSQGGSSFNCAGNSNVIGDGKGKTSTDTGVRSQFIFSADSRTSCENLKCSALTVDNDDSISSHMDGLSNSFSDGEECSSFTDAANHENHSFCGTMSSSSEQTRSSSCFSVNAGIAAGVDVGKPESPCQNIKYDECPKSLSVNDDQEKGLPACDANMEENTSRESSRALSNLHGESPKFPIGIDKSIDRVEKHNKSTTGICPSAFDLIKTTPQHCTQAGKENNASTGRPSCSSSKRPMVLLDVSTMNDVQLAAVKKNTLQAEEVSCSLVFSDGSSQLRELPQRRKRRGPEEKDLPRATSLVLAVPVKSLASSQSYEDGETTTDNDEPGFNMSFYNLPLERKAHAALFPWTRELLCGLMSSGSRKVCFDAQELIISLIECFNIDEKVCCHWRLLDMKIAGWMLDPDNPPETFASLLKIMRLHGWQKAPATVAKFHSKSLKHMVCIDLLLCGPTMLKIYQLLQDLKLWKLFFNVEMKLSPLLAVMESNGICINVSKLMEYSQLLQKEVDIVVTSAHKAAGHPFSLSSVSQLRKVLYHELKLDEKVGLKVPRTQAGTVKSTAEYVLQQLQDAHELPSLILKYRHLTKVKSTFVDGLLPHIEKGVLRTCWLHTGTATGRLTSANPNVQNIPKTALILSDSTMESSSVSSIHPRNIFQSSQGWTLLSADFQSIELRLLAHLSGDENLLSVFNGNHQIDVFTMLTSQWLGMNPDNVDSQVRERTKRLVYAVVYGVGCERLSEVLRVPVASAREYMDSFLAKFPGLQKYTRRTVGQCREDGLSRTMFGRRRLLQDINAPGRPDRLHAERQSGNFVIQGSAADICKIAMLLLVEVLQEKNLRARLLLQIHDELLLEVPDEELDETQGIVKKVLQDKKLLCAGFGVDLKVDLPITLQCGRTWGSMSTVDTTSANAASQ